MIPEVDAVLRTLLASTGATVRFTLPDPDEDGSRAVVLMLHRVTEDVAGRLAGWRDHRDAQGRVVARRPPLRRYRMDYLATAWATDVAAEHALLADVLTALAEVESVDSAHLTDPLRAGGEPVVLSVAHPDAEIPDRAALGVGARPVLTLRVTVALPAPRQPVADAPAEIALGVAADTPPAPEPLPTPPPPGRRISEPTAPARSTS